MILDLVFGEDIRGDEALFIESKHIDGWDIDYSVRRLISESIRDGEINKGGVIFFRVIRDGIQQHGHGWISIDELKIVQWG